MMKVKIQMNKNIMHYDQISLFKRHFLFLRNSIKNIEYENNN